MKSIRLSLVLSSTLLFSQAALAADPALPTCKPGDGLTPIPVWQPSIDDKAYITSEPPQQAGQVIYIRASYAPTDTACNDETLHPLALRNTDGDPGGLSVNVKGNTTASNGNCTFDGFYRNEEVPGMHQGWIETYFGAVPASTVSDGKHCLATPPDK